MRQLLRRVPQLQRLAVVDAVATTGGFTAAANDLGVSQPAVSRHIATLERQLGVTLYDRSTGTMTDAGQRLADATARAFAGIERAIDDVVSADVPLVIAVQPAMATSWVVPHLDAIEAAAGAPVRLRVYDRSTELAGDDWDLAIVPGDGQWATWSSIELFGEAVRPFASPPFAREHGLGPDSAPAELVTVPLLHIDSIERPSMAWPEWFDTFGVDAPAVPRVVYDSYPTVVQEALVGRGVVLGWQHLTGDLIERELLVPVGPVAERPEIGHHLCWRPGRSEPAGAAVGALLVDLIDGRGLDTD